MCARVCVCVCVCVCQVTGKWVDQGNVLLTHNHLYTLIYTCYTQPSKTHSHTHTQAHTHTRTHTHTHTHSHRHRLLFSLHTKFIEQHIPVDFLLTDTESELSQTVPVRQPSPPPLPPPPPATSARTSQSTGGILLSLFQISLKVTYHTTRCEWEQQLQAV